MPDATDAPAPNTPAARAANLAAARRSLAAGETAGCAGDEMRAPPAAFPEFRDGLTARRRSHDRFAPS